MSLTRRRFTRLLAALLATPSAACARCASAESSPDKSRSSKGPEGKRAAGPEVTDATRRPAGGVPRLGINLAGCADYSAELPLVDVFRMAREWISQQEGKPFGQGPELELDDNGWVKRLAPNCRADAYLVTIASVPPGEWTVHWEGEGDVEMWGEPVESQRRVDAHQLVFRTKQDHGTGFVLQLLKTDPGNPVRNIRVLMPGFTRASLDALWNPRFLDRWRGMAALRFMDMMSTNGSTQAQWSGRPTLDSATFTARGAPVEALVDLANRLASHPWFCMPHMANDDYVRRFAKVVKERLAPGLRIYVEYSNEVWNGAFVQCRYAHEQGVKAKLAKGPSIEANAHFYARRATEMFRIWEQVFGGKERLVRVLSSQAANPYVAEQIVGYKDAARHADALAVAPYIGCNVHGEGNHTPKASEVAGWSLDKLFAYLETTALSDTVSFMRENKKVADRHGLQLIAYEGGQHLVGVMGGENNEAVTKLLTSAQNDPRMGKLYERYYKAWEEAGGDLLCHFSSVGGYSKWGSWGLLESWDSDPKSSPKFMATMRWAASRGQKVSLPHP